MTVTTRPTFSPVGEDTGNLLDTIYADWRPFAERDKDTVAQAIWADARTNNAQVSPNRVRAALAELPVLKQPKPQRVGAVYRALCLQGFLTPIGFEESDDLAGRNRGKPHRVYRWVGGSR